MKTLLLILIGCAAVAGNGFGDGTNVPPVELSFIHQIPNSKEAPVYDAALPGFRSSAQIVVGTIKPKTKELPAKLVLVIQTTPGLPPMLEDFGMRSPKKTVQTGLRRRHEDVVETGKEAKREQVPAGTYFKFTTTRTEVVVTFMPKAMEMLKDECSIEWTDWHRH